MILIADSGSTKTDWRLLSSEGEISQAKTAGFNPYYQDVEEIVAELRKELLPQLTGVINAVHYYGAGVSGEKNSGIISGALASVFPQAEKVEVAHDLLGAARALCGKTPGIACILGTGANSCLYDGREITENIGGLGYVFGDEGSGASLGKQLVSDYLHKVLPEDLSSAFDKRHKVSREEILESVYKKPMPNRYLAGYSRFVFHHRNHPYIYRLIYSSFQDFMEKNVLQYKEYRQYAVHFVGSVAFYYSDILRQVANDMGIAVKNIMETPIAGLALFHLESNGK